MSKVVLESPKFGKQEVLVDEEDLWIMNGSWGMWSTKRHSGIYVINHGGKKDPHKGLRLHRVVMQTQDPKLIVDHINGNPLDNRKCNLRITDSTGNNRNARKRKDGVTSKYKGVDKLPNGKYRAQIQHKGKKYTKINFKTQKEAARQYNLWAEKFFGEFAVLNKILTPL